MINHLLQSICFTTMLLFCTSVSATDYVVYSITGDVHFANNKKEIRPRTTISSKESIYIGAESALILLEERSCKMFCFTRSKPTIATIDKLIRSTEKHVSDLPKHFFSYMIKQLFSEESSTLLHPDTYMQTTATSYRSGQRDSLLLNKLALMLSMENDLKERSIESRLIDSSTFIDSDFDVSFQLISCQDDLPISREVNVGTNCYVRVTNNSTRLLFVNILNIDAHGGKYLVLPVDAAASCRHLIVPPASTISFKSEPFEFVDDGQTETFLLIATEEPVDFSILMNPIQSSGQRVTRAGIYRKQFFTH